MNEFDYVIKDTAACNNNQVEVNSEKELKIKKYNSLSEFYDKIKKIESDKGMKII